MKCSSKAIICEKGQFKGLHNSTVIRLLLLLHSETYTINLNGFGC